MTNLELARLEGQAPWEDLERDLGTVKVFKDKYPVAPGHLLFVPTQNTTANIMDCFRWAYLIGREMMEKGGYHAFNIGMNIGEDAGQTVMYPHIHMIPRRKGDCEDPTGGVRNVIPGKGNYKK